MRQRWLLTLVLLLASAVMLTIALFTPLQEEKDTTPLTPLLEDQLHHIVMQRPVQADLVLEKQADGWYITAPIQLPAHGFRIHNLQRILQEENHRELDATQVDLAELGLAPAETVVTFNHDIRIVFGDPSPLKNGQRYIQVNDKVYLHLDTVSYLLDDTPLQFVSMTVLGHTARITELELPDYHLKQMDGRWTLLRQPEPVVDISTDSLVELVDNWQRLRALRVETYPGVAAVLGQVRVQLAGKTAPLLFDVLAAKPTFILGWPEKGIQFELADKQYTEVMGLM